MSDDPTDEFAIKRLAPLAHMDGFAIFSGDRRVGMITTRSLFSFDRFMDQELLTAPIQSGVV